MAQLVPIRYVEFYDVPRSIVLRYRGALFLLQSAFDEELDDYPNSYTVYTLPESAEDSLDGQWRLLDRRATGVIGQVRIDSLTFDPTKRMALDPSFLDSLLGEAEGYHTRQPT